MSVAESNYQSSPVEQGQQESIAQYSSRIALRYAWIAGVVSALLVLLLNARRNPIPMLDDARGLA